MADSQDLKDIDNVGPSTSQEEEQLGNVEEGLPPNEGLEGEGEGEGEVEADGEAVGQEEEHVDEETAYVDEETAYVIATKEEEEEGNLPPNYIVEAEIIGDPDASNSDDDVIINPSIDGPSSAKFAVLKIKRGGPGICGCFGVSQHCLGSCHKAGKYLDFRISQNYSHGCGKHPRFYCRHGGAFNFCDTRGWCNGWVRR